MKTNIANIVWPLVGNKRISEFLSKNVVGGELSGAYIFNGPDNLGKTGMALNFAKILLCQNKSGILPCGACPSCKKFSSEELSEVESGNIHSDLYLIKKEKDKKNISIEQTRGFIRFLNLSSFLNSYKIGVIKHAHLLSEEAANSILKTLEEPKEKVVIILMTENLSALPATIVSRSKVLNFRLVGFDVIYNHLINDRKISRSMAKNYARASLGRPALAVKFSEDDRFRDAYFLMVKTFLDSCAGDINERLSIMERTLDKKMVGQELCIFAGRMLEVWQGIARDFILLEFGRDDLLQHEIFKDDFLRLKGRFKIPNLVGLLERIKESKKYLAANVSPRAILENVIINI